MITLYSTHCPKCNILKAKMDQKGIVYDMIEDVDIMMSKNFMSLPMLEVDGNVMDFGAAVKWVNGVENVK